MERIDVTDAPGNETAYTATAKDIARRYSVSRAHVYNLVNRGMPHRKIGQSVRFNLEEVDGWMTSRTPTQAAS